MTLAPHLRENSCTKWGMFFLSQPTMSGFPKEDTMEINPPMPNSLDDPIWRMSPESVRMAQAVVVPGSIPMRRQGFNFRVCEVLEIFESCDKECC